VGTTINEALEGTSVSPGHCPLESVIERERKEDVPLTADEQKAAPLCLFQPIRE
jgi:hypothetical protein